MTGSCVVTDKLGVMRIRVTSELAHSQRADQRADPKNNNEVGDDKLHSQRCEPPWGGLLHDWLGRRNTAIFIITIAHRLVDIPGKA
jgi:hypothetical protein